jgi:hypothetical protein
LNIEQNQCYKYLVAFVPDAFDIEQNRRYICHRICRTVNPWAPDKQFYWPCRWILLDYLAEIVPLLSRHVKANRGTRMSVKAAISVMYAVLESVQSRNDIAGIVN